MYQELTPEQRKPTKAERRAAANEMRGSMDAQKALGRKMSKAKARDKRAMKR
jgi:hypothetical protein